MTRMHVEVDTPTDGTIRVAVFGEVDLAVRDRLLAALIAAIDLPDVDLVAVDLSSVRFLDAAGIGGLVAAGGAATRRGKALRVCGAVGPVRLVLDVTRVSELLGAGGDS